MNAAGLRAQRTAHGVIRLLHRACPPVGPGGHPGQAGVPDGAETD